MKLIKWFAAAGLVVVLLPSLYCETRCPGNAASIRLRFTGLSLIAVPVMLDNTGPYDFVVDTGAQITTVDPRLASELHTRQLGTAHVTGIGTYSQAAYAQVSSLRAGTYSITSPIVLVQDLSQIQQTDPRIRGILGENFLEHFDLLIDYEHRILCLDDSRQMQQKIKGERVALTPPPHADQYLPYTLPMIISLRLSGVPGRPLLLQLDSGSDVPVLFACGKLLPRVQIIITQGVAVLTPQDMRVGAHPFRQISFLTPLRADQMPVKPDVDGVLPTILFRSAFISYADHFAVLEPRGTL